MDRKYRQRGYMDSNGRDEQQPERPPRPELTEEEKIQRRSMRKATNREANEVVRCHACGRNVDASPIATSTVCPFCTAALHCCRTCKSFDSSARWQCRADIAEPVSDKAKSNTCAQFIPRLVLDVTGRRGPSGPGSGSGGNSGGSSNDPRTQFENLFRR